MVVVYLICLVALVVSLIIWGVVYFRRATVIERNIKDLLNEMEEELNGK